MIKNKKGTTLVELLVALAILAIVLVWVGNFMLTGTKLFHRESSKAYVQNEVQLASNMLVENIKSSQLGISFGTGEFGSLDYSYTDVDADQKFLLAFSWSTDRSTIDCQVFQWVKEDNKLYTFTVYDVPNDFDEEDNSLTVIEALKKALNGRTVDSERELLADHIADFGVDMSEYDAKSKIELIIEAERQKETHENSSTIIVRNDILVNATSIGQLYEKAGVSVATIIEKVMIASNKSTVPGGAIQLTTNVLGQGYPSQNIYKWVICTGQNGTPEQNKVYDSMDPAYNSATTYIDNATKVLHVSPDLDIPTDSNAWLRVYAYVNTRSTSTEHLDNTVNGIVYMPNEEDPTTILIYAQQEITVKKVSQFSIQPTFDTTGANANLNGVAAAREEYFEADGKTVRNNDVIPELSLIQGNVIQMTSYVTGSSLDEDDKRVVWTVEERSDDNVEATLNSNGAIAVSKYSNAGYIVVSATSVLDANMKLYYKINVGYEMNGDARTQLEITAPSDSMNRGSSMQLGLKFNSADVSVDDYSNFVWILTIKTTSGQVVTNQGTLSSGGLLAISENLNFDYAYKAKIRVQMKNNSAIFTEKDISIPRVTITLNKKTLAGAIPMSVPAGTFIATVKGIEASYYNLTWEMASATNENQYHTAYVSGSNITGINGQNTCTVNISSTEPQALEFFRVRCTISGHPTFNATAKIVFNAPPVSFSLDSAPTTVARGNTVKLTPNCDQTNYDYKDVTWEIVTAVTDKNATVPASELEKLRTATNFVNKLGYRELKIPSDFYLSSDKVIVTIKAMWDSYEASTSVTVSPITINLTVENSPAYNSRGSYASVYATYSFSGSVKWSVVGESSNMYEKSETTSGVRNKLTLPANYKPENPDSMPITIRCTSSSNANIYAEKTITFTQPVKLTLSLGAGTSKILSANISGVTDDIRSGFKVIWGISKNSISNPTFETIKGLGYTITGVTLSPDSTTLKATLTDDNSLPNYYVYAFVQYGGTVNFGGQGKGIASFNVVNFELKNPTDRSIAYGSEKIIQFNKTSYQKKENKKWVTDYYYANQLRYNSKAVGSVTYYKTILQSCDGAGKTFKGNTNSYYANNGDKWYVWETNSWAEVSTSSKFGSTNTSKINVLNAMKSGSGKYDGT